MISLTITKSSQKRGKGLWKFNNALLENQDFCDMIRSEILLIQETYALPIYDPNFVAFDKGATLEISITSTLFLETLLCQLRGKIIKFSKNLKKKETEVEESLIKSISILQKDIDSNTNDNLLKINSLREQTLQLENLREKKIKGSMIRSRAALIDNWGKPSKYFLNLEMRNYVNKNIPSLKDEKDHEIFDSAEILLLQRNFYEDLYSSIETISINESKYSYLLGNLPILSDYEKLNLEAPYSLEELITTIKNSKLNKAPGPDGYSNEFF